jgi:prune family protein 2
VDVKQPFTVKVDGENPDILIHCDPDGNSHASNSPDICHDSEAKQETEQHIGACMEPGVETSEFYLTESKMNEEPGEEPVQESVPYNSELYSENAIPLPPVNIQGNINDSSQPASGKGSPETSEVNDDKNTGLIASEKGADPDTAPILELVDRTIPRIENVGTSIFLTYQEPTMEGNNSSWISEDFSSGSHTGTGALCDCEQSFAPGNLAAVTDALLVSDTCLDISEAAFDHSFSDASGLNTSTGTIDDMSKLTLSEGHPDTPVDGDTGKQDICSSEASWGDFEDVMGQNIDEDLMKEPEHFRFGGDPLLEEDALKQSLTPYTPPFDLSYLTEPTHYTETTEETRSPEDVSLGSEAAEMLLSALPDQSEGNHSETKSRQDGHQLVVLHIHEDPATGSLPVGRTGSNTESSPSNIDWDVETDNSDSPAGGDIEPPNGKKHSPFLHFEEIALIKHSTFVKHSVPNNVPQEELTIF